MNFSYFRLWQQGWACASSHDHRMIIIYHLMYIVSVSIQLTQPYLLGKLVNVLQVERRSRTTELGLTPDSARSGAGSSSVQSGS